MSALEDNILGGNSHNYCSSSEDEQGEEADGDKPATPEAVSSTPRFQPSINPNSGRRWEGYSRNTGPKGVLQDWELFKEQEERLRNVEKKELLELIQTKALTCSSSAEDDRKVQAAESEDQEDLLSDSTLQEFLRKRMDLMMKNHTSQFEFGEIVEITSGEEYLKTIDETNSEVVVVVHIYETRNSECIKMNHCLSSLSRVYRNVKFCKILAGIAGVSHQFRTKGVPAILVYKGGSMIGNFVQLKEELGNDFCEGDVENFLIENGILEDGNNLPKLYKKTNTNSLN